MSFLLFCARALAAKAITIPKSAAFVICPPVDRLISFIHTGSNGMKKRSRFSARKKPTLAGRLARKAVQCRSRDSRVIESAPSLEHLHRAIFDAHRFGGVRCNRAEVPSVIDRAVAKVRARLFSP